MNKLPLIIGLIAAALLIGGGAYFWNSSRSQSAQTGTNSDPVTDTSAEESRSIADIMALGDTMECDYDYADESGSWEGTLYVDNTRVRGDFMGTFPDGEDYQGSMINDGKYMYNWSNTMQEGMMMAVPNENERQDYIEEYSENPDSPQYIDMQKDMNMDCRAWRVDESKFIPPTDITFTDFSEQMQMMQQLQQENPDATAPSCATCDSLTGDAQSACRQAFGC